MGGVFFFFFFVFFWVLPPFLGGGWSGVAMGYLHGLKSDHSWEWCQFGEPSNLSSMLNLRL
jgi:hypothetical protein